MPPLRSTRSTRSQTAAAYDTTSRRSHQVDHDVFEGLPVRRWARQATTYSQVPKVEETKTNLTGPNNLPELPMPRESNLLTPMSRALLRAARAGCTYIRRVNKEPTETEDAERGEDEAAEPVVYERTFSATKWAVIPRNTEPPEPEFLAKRRPGLSTLYGTGAAAIAAATNVSVAIPARPPMRKTKFKRVDSETGEITIYKALVPEGYKVDGELSEDTDINAENPETKIVNAAPAPGTMIEGVGLVDAEGNVVAERQGNQVSVIRKKYVPPKRKAKGNPKGRKKKVMFAPTDGTTEPIAPGTYVPSDFGNIAPEPPLPDEGSVTVVQTPETQKAENDVKQSNDGDPVVEPKPTPDIEMGDEKVVVADEDVVMADAAQPLPPIPASGEQERPELEHIPTSIPPRDISSSPDLPLAAIAAASQSRSRSASDKPRAGSPQAQETVRHDPIISPPVKLGESSQENNPDSIPQSHSPNHPTLKSPTAKSQTGSMKLSSDQSNDEGIDLLGRLEATLDKKPGLKRGSRAKSAAAKRRDGPVEPDASQNPDDDE